MDDLLDITRVARGKIRLQRENVELGGLVLGVTEDHRSLLGRAGIALDTDIVAQPLCVEGDPARLAQGVGNLLQNAAKFTLAGGRVNVSLQVEPPGQAVLRVRDTGAGISADILGHLFEPFVQGERTIDRSNGGLGLGLALAQGIAQLHGGSITATSDGPGRGAEFTVRLPALSGTSPKLSLVRSEAPSGAARRVLIIEDMRDAAESLQEALDMIGHVARALRSQPVTESALLVALSGYVSQNDVDRARQAGFDEHMAKPPRLDVLEKLLARAGH